MASFGVSGAGIGLRAPQRGYPVTVGTPGSPQLVGTNRLSLAAGQVVTIPAGTFWVDPGDLCQIQVLDPITGVWGPYSSAPAQTPIALDSDGYNYRVANLTGCVVAVVVTNGGTGYTSAPTVTAAGTNATFVAIVGGALSAININAASSGANYSYPPNVSIDAPAVGGVPATAHATISGGVITSIVIDQPGAGYATVPNVAIVPDPSDPNLGTITDAAATAVTSYVGVVTAVLVSGHGLPQTATPALTFSGGGGSGATATAAMAFVATGYTVTTPGSGYSGSPAILTYDGALYTDTSGVPATGSQDLMQGWFVPRQAVIVGATSSGGISANGGTNGGIVDRGLFATVPRAYAVPGPVGAATTAANITITVGGVTDEVYMQQLG